MQIKFYIIIPIYNVESYLAYLAQCLDSVLCQTHSSFEAILINDSSTEKIAKDTESQVQYPGEVKVSVIRETRAYAVAG